MQRRETKEGRNKHKPQLLRAIGLLSTGTLISYAFFFFHFNLRYVRLLEIVERNHNKTRLTSIERFNKESAKLQKCREDMAPIVENSVLRGKLEGLSDLVDKHNALIGKYRALEDDYYYADSEQKSAAHRFSIKLQELQHELAQQNDEIDEERSRFIQLQHENAQKALNMETIIQQMESKLTETRLRFEEVSTLFHGDLKGTEADEGKPMDLDSYDLSSLYKHCSFQHPQIRTHYQKYQDSICTKLYGAGPYYVKFDVKFDDEFQSFVLEIPSRKHMPHSVFTFLSLVESEYYNGGVIGNESNNNSLVISQKAFRLGHPYEDSRPGWNSNFQILSFFEESPAFPCESHSVAFSRFGPSLNIYLSEDSPSPKNRCFGSVIRGQKLASRIGNSAPAEVKIIQAKLLIVPQ